MTKKVRIENADLSSKQIVVQVWDKAGNDEPDTLVETRELLNPTDLAEVVIHGSRYVVVKEAA